MKLYVIYIADHEEERYAIEEFFKNRGIDVSTAKTEKIAREIVLQNPTIKLIIIGAIEKRKPELMNSSPCDTIPKVLCIVDEDEDELRSKYKSVIRCLDMHKPSWLDELVEQVIN